MYSTLGLREGTHLLNHPVASVGQSLTLGWRHAYHHITPIASQAFASGSNAFSIAGVPIAEDSFLIDASLIARAIAKPVTARLAYSGQIAHQTQDHGVYGNVVWQFD